MRTLLFFIVCTILFLSNSTLGGDIKKGEKRYSQNCGNCHGPAGMGLASYPKLKGKDIEYLIDRLKTYRDGKKIGPNSSLMIMMARPLSDEEIENLATYLNAQK
tara:strand:+ start:407 stop:718 length:312 start_codon:yes stop_codon:yes gene_type:complete